MPEVLLRDGIDPDDPDEVLLAVVIDPEGSPGERAIAEIGDLSCVDEEDRVCYVLQTDAYADSRIEDGVLTVDIMFYAAAIHASGIEKDIGNGDFERSEHDPIAVRVLRVTGTTTYTEDDLPDTTLVYLAPLDQLEEDELPLLLAPAPEPEAELRAGLHPADPEAVHLAVAIDPERFPGERVVAKVSDYCFEDEENLQAHILQTDAWADPHLEDGMLTVDLYIYEARLESMGIDPAGFPDRSPHEPLARRVVRATGTTDHDTLPDEILLFFTPLDQLGEEDLPFVLAPPPEA